MNVTSKENIPLRDVLYAFSLAKETPDAAVLDDFVRKYPEHAAELTDFAVEMIMDAALGQQDIVSEAVKDRVSPVVSRALSRFENRLFETRRDQAPAKTDTSPQSAVQNPFALLDRTAFRLLVNGLHANNLFVARLRDREIDVDTMSEGFKRRVANELNVSVGLVTAHFSARPQIEGRQFYKAEEKPEVSRKITFEEAVNNSGLSEEQRRFLFTL